MTPENEKLLERLNAIDQQVFADALLKLFDIIDDRRFMEHIAGEFKRFHEAFKRNGVATLSPLALGALVALLDYVSFGTPLGFDRARAESVFRSSNAVNN